MYRFIAGSSVCKGSTHDSVALRLSHIGRYLNEGRLTKGLHIVGDDAYGSICPEQLLTPYRRGLMSKYELSFNFFQSSHLVHVEQAFVLLVRRWGILWRPLKFKLETISLIITVSILLHNFCIDQDRGVVKRQPTLEEKVRAWQDLEIWLEWCNGRRSEHADAILGISADSIPDTANMHLANKSLTSAKLVMLLRIKVKLHPQLDRLTWLDVLSGGKGCYYDSDESDGMGIQDIFGDMEEIVCDELANMCVEDEEDGDFESDGQECSGDETEGIDSFEQMW